MSDRWFKPDFQEIGVAGECTAYAGTQDNCETNALSACREATDRASGEDPLRLATLRRSVVAHDASAKRR